MKLKLVSELFIEVDDERLQEAKGMTKEELVNSGILNVAVGNVSIVDGDGNELLDEEEYNEVRDKVKEAFMG